MKNPGRDPRYGSVKFLIESGHITSIHDIFLFIPKTTIHKDLGINFNRFGQAILDPSLFKVEELKELAELFDVDAKKFVDMAFEQSLTAKKKRTKK